MILTLVSDVVSVEDSEYYDREYEWEYPDDESIDQIAVGVVFFSLFEGCLQSRCISEIRLSHSIDAFSQNSDLWIFFIDSCTDLGEFFFGDIGIIYLLIFSYEFLRQCGIVFWLSEWSLIEEFCFLIFESIDPLAVWVNLLGYRLEFVVRDTKIINWIFWLEITVIVSRIAIVILIFIEWVVIRSFLERGEEILDTTRYDLWSRWDLFEYTECPLSGHEYRSEHTIEEKIPEFGSLLFRELFSGSDFDFWLAEYFLTDERDHVEHRVVVKK